MISSLIIEWLYSSMLCVTFYKKILLPCYMLLIAWESVWKVCIKLIFGFVPSG